MSKTSRSNSKTSLSKMEPTLSLEGTTNDIIDFIKKLKESGKNIDDQIDAGGTFKIDHDGVGLTGYTKSVGLIDYKKQIFYATPATGEDSRLYRIIKNIELANNKKQEERYKFWSEAARKRFIYRLKGGFEQFLYSNEMKYFIKFIKEKYPYVEYIGNIEGLKLVGRDVTEIDIKNEKVNFGGKYERIEDFERVGEWGINFDDKQALEKFKKRLDAMSG